jgi:hypothetical protein
VTLPSRQGLRPVAGGLVWLLRYSKPARPQSLATVATECRRIQTRRAAPDNGPDRGRAGTVNGRRGAVREVGTADRPTADSGCSGAALTPYRPLEPRHDRPSEFGYGFVRRPDSPAGRRPQRHRPAAPAQAAAASAALSAPRRPRAGRTPQTQSSPRSRGGMNAAAGPREGFDARFHPFRLPFTWTARQPCPSNPLQSAKSAQSVHRPGRPQTFWGSATNGGPVRKRREKPGRAMYANPV